jgi:hypothetical protein
LQIVTSTCTTTQKPMDNNICVLGASLGPFIWKLKVMINIDFSTLPPCASNSFNLNTHMCMWDGCPTQYYVVLFTLITLEPNPDFFEVYTFQNNMDKQAKQKVIVVLQNI